MEETYTVYLHKSPSNKYYVGITHLNPIYRWRNGKGYSTRHFSCAIKKYGWENFEHIIIAENLTREAACNMEIELIKKYNSTNPEFGYNHSTGGDKGALGCRYTRGEFSDEHKKALSDAWVSRKKRGLGTAWNKGLSRKQDLTNFLLAGKNNIEKLKRPIVQIDLKTNKVIREFSSITDAAHYLNKSYVSSIIDCAKGNRKSAFGYKWMYKNHESKSRECTRIIK